MTPNTCCHEKSDTTEVKIRKREAFWRYIKTEVNPARVANGLEELSQPCAETCFRIIYDFQEKWEKGRTP